MKTIVLGDIHGQDIWKEIVNKEKFDKAIFVGDYFDSFNINGRIQIDNFKDIVEFKRQNKDKVILLIGNHDLQYLTGNTCSGYQQMYASEIRENLNVVLKEEFIQVCVKKDKYLISHAGVSKTWCKENNIDLKNVESSINNKFKEDPNIFEFTPDLDYYDASGDNVCQTPLWIRPRSLIKDRLDGYIQIFGHTVIRELSLEGVKFGVINVDVFQTSGQYLIIENDELKVGTTNYHNSKLV